MPNIPLNYFKRYAYTLTNTPSAIYTAPYSRAAVILNGYVTNTSLADTTVTISVSGKGDAINFIPTKPEYYFAKDLLVGGKDTTNVFPSKFVLEASDSLIISTASPTPGSVTLNMGILETLNTTQ